MPNGLALGMTTHYPGSVSDFEILQRNRDWHLRELAKSGSERDFEDLGRRNVEYPQMWATLIEKGYQRVHEILRGVTPWKKPRNGTLSRSDERYNCKLSSDCVIVEKFLGRLCGLWTLLSRRWRWEEGIYDEYFRLGVAWTNFHIKYQPLRATDQERFTRIRNRMHQIAETAIDKRRRVLQRYREWHRQRVNHAFRFTQYDSELPDFEYGHVLRINAHKTAFILCEIQCG